VCVCVKMCEEEKKGNEFEARARYKISRVHNGERGAMNVILYIVSACDRMIGAPLAQVDSAWR